MDVISLIGCFLVAYYLRHDNLSGFFNSSSYRTLLLMIIMIDLILVFFTQPYKNILRRSNINEIRYSITNTLYNFLLVSFVLVLTKTSALYSRIIISTTYIMYLFTSFVIRCLWKQHIRRESVVASTNSDSKLLVITDSKNIDRVIDSINKYNYSMYEICGLCILDKNMKDEEIEGYKVVANKKDVMSYICVNWIDEVYVAMEYSKVPSFIFDGLAAAGVTTNIMIGHIEEFEGREQIVKKMFNTAILNSSIKSRTNLQIFMKRLMDIAGGLIGSAITLLLTVFIGPAIYLKSPGQIFYKQKRIGQNGRRFNMYKFRSMVTNADELKADLMKQNRIKDGMMFKVKDDPRIIPGVGEFIRKTSLDEFPQFFNVLKGDMSLVGTRPPTVDEWKKYKLEHRIRMAIKPGITGMWQVNGRSKITDFDKVIEYDTRYINNWSIWLDIEILFKTVLVLFSKREDEAM